jgi:hypothetical protein
MTRFALGGVWIEADREEGLAWGVYEGAAI